MKNFVKITLSCPISEINVFCASYTEIQNDRKKWHKNIFLCQKLLVDSVDKIFIEIALSCTVSEINVFSSSYTEIQDGRQNMRENDVWQKVADDSADTLQIKNFVEITLSYTVSEILKIFHFHR